MFGWAMENDLADRNPALRIKKMDSGEGFHAWTIAEVEQFEATHPPGTKANLFMNIALYTGLQLQELAIMGRPFEAGGSPSGQARQRSRAELSFRSRSCLRCRRSSIASRKPR
jgi:hypothetical protein